MSVCCVDCNVELILNENWRQSQAKINNRRCIPCQKIHKRKSNDKTNPKFNKKRIFFNNVYQPVSSPWYDILPGGNYKSLDDALFKNSPVNNIEEGYVYIITNRAWPEWIKIGMALDAEDRCGGYQTSSPYRDYVLEYSVFTENRRKAEKKAHTKAAKLASETNGEWFKLDVETAKHILDKLNEHGRRATKKANTDTKEDKLQERPAQGDLWSYAENKKAG
jgi:hypothetical protein